MRITAYRTTAYKNTSVYETDKILVNVEPEYMDDETRKGLNDNGEIPYFCFQDKISNSYICMPPEFVIKIE